MCPCTLLVVLVAEHEEGNGKLWGWAQGGHGAGAGQEPGEKRVPAGCEVPRREHAGAVPAAGASTSLCLQGMSPRSPLLQPPSPRVMSHHPRMRNHRVLGAASSHPPPTAFPELSSFSPVPPAEQTHPGAISHPAGPLNAQQDRQCQRSGAPLSQISVSQGGRNLKTPPSSPQQDFLAKFGRPGRAFDYLM